jgi:hypothetical protein
MAVNRQPLSSQLVIDEWMENEPDLVILSECCEMLIIQPIQDPWVKRNHAKTPGFNLIGTSFAQTFRSGSGPVSAK